MEKIKEFIMNNKIIVCIILILLVLSIVGCGTAIFIGINNNDTKEVENKKENNSSINEETNKEEVNDEEETITEEESSPEKEEDDQPSAENNDKTENSTSSNSNNKKPSSNKQETSSKEELKEEKEENSPSSDNTSSNTNSNTGNSNNNTDSNSNNSNNSNSSSNSDSNNSNSSNNTEKEPEDVPVEEPEEPSTPTEAVKKGNTTLDCKHQSITANASVSLSYNFVWNELNKMINASQIQTVQQDLSAFSEIQLQAIDGQHNKNCANLEANGAKKCTYVRNTNNYSITIEHDVNELSKTTNGLLNSSMSVNEVKNKLESNYNNKMTCTIK